MVRTVLLALLLPVAAGGATAPGSLPERASGPFREYPVPGRKQLKRGAELLSRAVEALGGAAALDRLRTLETRAVGTRRTPAGQDIDVRTTIQVDFPERYRQELVLPTGAVVTLINGANAYLLAGGGVLPLSHQERGELEQLIHRSLYGVLRNRTDRDNPPAAVGRDVVEGRKVELVRLGIQPDAVTLAIDPKSFAILRLSYITRARGAVGEFAVLFSDYRPVDGGLKFPFALSATFEGQPAYTSRLEAVRVNGSFDPKLFEPPAPPAPSAVPTPGGSPEAR